ncbi:MAG: DUF4054 domain-containing protein [Betaproteobacteria bacterium]|nr:DUF4054 domain-containing protein [Betaproteobacteria bacterium]
MANPRLEDFRVRFPEFDGAGDPQVAQAIEDALPWLDAARWGAFYEQGWAALAAHFLVGDSAAKGKSGPLLAANLKKVGEVQIGLATPNYRTPDDAWLASTTYGQRFIALRRMAGLGAIAV